MLDLAQCEIDVVNRLRSNVVVGGAAFTVNSADGLAEAMKQVAQQLALFVIYDGSKIRPERIGYGSTQVLRDPFAMTIAAVGQSYASTAAGRSPALALLQAASAVMRVWQPSWAQFIWQPKRDYFVARAGARLCYAAQFTTTVYETV